MASATATVTLFLGGTIGGSETVNDALNGSFTGNLSNTVFDFTIIKKFEINIEHHSGESGYYGTSMEFNDITFDYPVIDQKKCLII